MGNFNYGKNLKRVRLLREISQKKMALGLDISQATYSRIEGQSQPPDEMTQARIANILEVSSLELMPPIDELELDQRSAIYRFRLDEKGRKVLKAPYGKVIIYGSAAALLSVSFEIGGGFFRGMGASDEIAHIMSWVFAVATFFYLYYRIKHIDKVKM